MPADGFTFATGSATDKGRVRPENEDAMLVAPQVGLWAVADGMGGHEAGRLASDTIVDELRTVVPPASASELLSRCGDAVFAAHGRLLALSTGRGGAIIGTTLVALLIFENFYACLWAGDSRLYIVRDGVITLLTSDHTEVADLVAKGLLMPEEADRWPRRNVITRAVGISERPELDMVSGDVQIDDTFLLCSDGLTAHVDAAEMMAIVTAARPQDACDRLTALTLERGATDNVTVLVVRCMKKTPTVVRAEQSPKVSWE